MIRFLRRKATADADIDANERIAEASADLAYELQSKMFDQLATVGVAGAGLAVTLIGSVLQDEPNDVWLSVVFFGMAAVTAITSNQRLVDGLMLGQPCLRRGKRDMKLTLMLVGIAIGWLSMTVYAKSARQPAPPAVERPSALPAPAGGK